MTPQTRQNLFNYLYQEHDIMLLDSDFNEIELMLAEKHLPVKTKEEIYLNSLRKITIGLMSEDLAIKAAKEYAQQSQTTPDIISQIEELKWKSVLRLGTVVSDHNDTIDTILEILRQSIAQQSEAEKWNWKYPPEIPDTDRFVIAEITNNHIKSYYNVLKGSTIKYNAENTISIIRWCELPQPYRGGI